MKILQKSKECFFLCSLDLLFDFSVLQKEVNLKIIQTNTITRSHVYHFQFSMMYDGQHEMKYNCSMNSKIADLVIGKHTFTVLIQSVFTQSPPA